MCWVPGVTGLNLTYEPQNLPCVSTDSGLADALAVRLAINNALPASFPISPHLGDIRPTPSEKNILRQKTKLEDLGNTSLPFTPQVTS